LARFRFNWIGNFLLPVHPVHPVEKSGFIVPIDHPVLAQRVPEVFWNFLRDDCHLPASAFALQPGPELPEPARQLLVHSRDMTSTLATYHESLIRIEILQCREVDGFYLREVFLRTLASGTLVEYGVLAIELAQFSEWQRDIIRAGQAPLGGLLHRFEIPFVSTPIGFFALAGRHLASTPLATPTDVTCYGRFNRLARESGEPLAWILEILPPA
jgi:chorismate-pyruvate lyase